MRLRQILFQIGKKF